MNSKQLLWLLAAACGVVILGVIAIRITDRSTAPAAGVNRPLLPDFPVNDIETVIVTGATGTGEVHKKNGIWCVPARNDYPANFTAVSQLLTEMAEMTAVQIVQAGESQYGRLKLLPPNKGGANSGIEVVCQRAGGKTVGHFILGKNYETPRSGEETLESLMYNQGGGRFLLLPEQKTVAVVKANFGPAATQASDWLDPEFLNLLEVKSVTLKDGDKTLWNLTRESAGGGLLLADLKAGETVDQDKVNRAGATWNWHRFADVAGKCADKPEARAEFKQELRATEFTGCEFILRLGDLTPDKQQRRVMVDALFTPQSRTPAKDEKPEAKKTADENHAKSQAENRKRVEDLKKLTADWIYLLPVSALEAIPQARDGFLKPPTPPEKPATPAAPAKPAVKQ